MNRLACVNDVFTGLAEFEPFGPMLRGSPIEMPLLEFPPELVWAAARVALELGEIAKALGQAHPSSAALGLMERAEITVPGCLAAFGAELVRSIRADITAGIA